MNRSFKEHMNCNYFLVFFFISGLLLHGFLNKYIYLACFTIAVFIYLILLDVRIKSKIILFYFLCVFLSWSLSWYNPNPYHLFSEILAILITVYIMNKKDLVFIENLFYIVSLFVFLNHILSRYLNLPLFFTSRNQNYEAFFYIIAFSFLLNKRQSFITLFFLLLIASVVFLIGSRIGVFSIMLLIVLRICYVKDKLNYFFIAMLFSLLLLILANYGDILKLSDPKAYKRVDMYLSSIKSFFKSPFIGWGLGSYEYVFEIFKFPYYDGFSFYNHSSIHAHSHLLNILVEGGMLFGFATFFLLYDAVRNSLGYTIFGILPFFFFDGILVNPFIKGIFFLLVGLNLKDDETNLKIRKGISFLMMLFLSLIYSIADKDLKIHHNSYNDILKGDNIFRIKAVSEYSYFNNPHNVVFLYLSSYLDDNRIDVLKKIISFEPNFTQAHIELCDLYLKLNKKRDFVECLKSIKFNSNCLIDDEYSAFLCKYDKEKYNSLKKTLNNY